jgi:hypothetical protein
MWVTVFDTYPIMDRKQKIDGASGALFKDWDLTYTNVPPTWSDIDTVYADITGLTTYTLSFAPTLTPNADSATIVSSSIDEADGTITASGGTAANPTWTIDFPNTATHRWVHLSGTDSNGVTQEFHFQVFTVDRFTASNVIKLDYGLASVSGNLDTGWSGEIEAWQDFDANDILDKTRVAIVVRSTRDPASVANNSNIQSNVMLVGELTTETNTTEIDPVFSTIQSTKLPITGLGALMGNLGTNPQPINDVTTPITWGDIKNPDPQKVIVNHLAYDSTALTVLPIEFGVAFDDYIFFGPSLNLKSKTILENLNGTLLPINGQTVTAPDGTIGAYRNANYLPITPVNRRSALQTIFTFDYDENDYVSIDSLNITTEGNVAQATAVGAVYNSTTKEITGVYTGQAPRSGFGAGYRSAELPGQILKTNQGVLLAQDEIAQRVANHKAYVSNKWVLSATMPGGYWWLVPNLHQWYLHILPATTNPRGRAFTASTRWVLTDVSITINNPEYDFDVTANWMIETIDTGAGVVGEKVPIVGDANDYKPPTSAFGVDFPDDPLSMFPDDLQEDIPYVSLNDDAAQPYPPGTFNDPPLQGEILSVPMFIGNVIATTRTSLASASYTVQVDGDGTVGSGGGSLLTFIDFSNPSLYSFPDTSADKGTKDRIQVNPSSLEVSPPAGSPTGGNAAKSGAVLDTGAIYGNSRYRNGATCQTITFGTPQTIDTIEFSAYRSNGTIPSGRDLGYRAEFYDSGGSYLGQYWRAFSVANNSWNTHTLTISDLLEGSNSNVSYIIIGAINGSGLTFTNTYYIDDITVNIVGATGSRGDAFYEGYDSGDGEATLYTGTNGLQIDGANPTPDPLYEPSHSYVFSAIGTGLTFKFKFQDSDYTDNSNNVLRVTIIGPNMGVSA